MFLDVASSIPAGASDAVALAAIGLCTLSLGIVRAMVKASETRNDKDRAERERDRVVRELEAKSNIDTAAATEKLIQVLHDAGVLNSANDASPPRKRAVRGHQ